jgi:hypothetical protein
MQRSKPENTKLTICVWHPFTQWRPTPAMPETLRQRWPTMKVVHLPEYKQLAEELPDTDIFVGYSLRPEQLVDARRLRALGAAGAMGSAAAPHRVEWASVADRGIWFDRPGTRATRHSV